LMNSRRFIRRAFLQVRAPRGVAHSVGLV
jgi:hypothetical protein